MASSGTKAVVVVLLVAVAGAAAWGWSEYRGRELRRTAGALVQDASTSLREGLRPAGASAEGRDRKLELDAKALDGGLAALARVDAGRDRALAYAAEEYAVSARQLLRDLAQEERLRRRVSERIRELSQHMNYADRRTPDFHRRALALKDELEKAYFDYGLVADTLARELDAFPDARAKVAAQLGASAVPDDALAADARRRAAQSARQVADEMERARRMAGAR
jgi:hypothetical protein